MFLGGGGSSRSVVAGEPTWGISATTGQLADNHDILSVETVAGEGDPERVTQGESSEAAALQREETALFSRVAARAQRERGGAGREREGTAASDGEIGPATATGAGQAGARAGASDRGWGYGWGYRVAVEDSLGNMVKKLEQRGDLSESRIQKLEASLKSDVQSSIFERMEERVHAVERVFDANLQHAVASSKYRWMIPFAIVLGVIVVIVAVVCMKYRNLQKTHIL